MFRALLAFLYGSVPETFPSDWPIEEAVKRLRTATAKSVFHALAQECAAGTVTARKVSLQRAIPFVGNAFKPFFVGRFRVPLGQTQLEGVFTMRWAAKGIHDILVWLWNALDSGCVGGSSHQAR